MFLFWFGLILMSILFMGICSIMEKFNLNLQDPWVPLEREPDPHFGTIKEKELCEEEI